MIEWDINMQNDFDKVRVQILLREACRGVCGSHSVGA